MKYYLFVIVGLISVPAMAGTTCISSAIVGGQTANPSAATEVPSNGSISGTVNINGYKINIDCDLNGRRRHHTLSLAITTPSGETASTSTGNELKLVNSSGDGVSVRCSDD